VAEQVCEIRVTCGVDSDFALCVEAQQDAAENATALGCTVTREAVDECFIATGRCETCTTEPGKCAAQGVVLDCVQQVEELDACLDGEGCTTVDFGCASCSGTTTCEGACTSCISLCEQACADQGCGPVVTCS